MPACLWHRKSTIIAVLSIVAIVLHLLLRFGFRTTPDIYQVLLLVTLVLGGLPLLYNLLRKLLKREFGSDSFTAKTGLWAFKADVLSRSLGAEAAVAKPSVIFTFTRNKVEILLAGQQLLAHRE